MSIPIPITLKWGKITYENNEHLIIHTTNASSSSSLSSHDFKQIVQSLTGVPVHRQKLLCPKVWKGALKDDIVDMSLTLSKTKVGSKKNIVVTLIGTADTLIETPMEDRPRFEEDMTPEEIWKATRKPQANNNNEGVEDEVIVDIIALQKEAGMERDDHKMEMYEYNRLVKGLPQHYINDVLVRRLRKANEELPNRDDSDGVGHDDSKPQSTKSTTMPLAVPPTGLTGEVAMTLGMELRRSYVNSLAILPLDGTIISGLDDGHVQLWHRGQLVKDARHSMAKSVDCVMAFPRESRESSTTTTTTTTNIDSNGPSFATAGDGSICLWNNEGEIAMQFGTYGGTTPSSIAVGTVGSAGAMGDRSSGSGGTSSTKYLASCFRITREVDPNRFRLLPQNEAERQRREVAEVQERLIQQELSRVSSCVKIWYYDTNHNSNVNAPQLREDVIYPDAVVEGTSTASVTKLLDMNGKLVCGDAWGAIRIYELSQSSESNNNNASSISRRQCAFLQFGGSSSIACMEQVMGEHLLAVSIEPADERDSNSRMIYPLATSFRVPSSRGVYIVDTKESTIKVMLENVHNDTVRCMCSLPDGGLLTAGGKMDATVRVWDSFDFDNASSVVEEENLDGATDEIQVLTNSKVLDQPGYVFDLKVLPDSNGSDVYAVAAARYNVIKIVI